MQDALISLATFQGAPQQAPRGSDKVSAAMAGMQAAFVLASREGNCAALERMAPLVDVDFRRGQALYEAVRHGHADAARILIALGADAGARGGLFLKMTAVSGDVDLLRLLLEHATHMREETQQGFECAQRLAAARGHTQMIELLITRGMGVIARGGAALQVSAQNGHVDIVRLLLEHKADASERQHRALRLAAGEYLFRMRACFSLFVLGI